MVTATSPTTSTPIGASRRLRLSRGTGSTCRDSISLRLSAYTSKATARCYEQTQRALARAQTMATIGPQVSQVRHFAAKHTPAPDAAAHLGLAVPLRYHPSMAMNLRLTDAESEALRKKAEQEGRSMQEVARAAIAQYVSERPQRLRAAIERVRAEDSELLARLSR